MCKWGCEGLSALLNGANDPGLIALFNVPVDQSQLYRFVFVRRYGSMVPLS